MDRPFGDRVGSSRPPRPPRPERGPTRTQYLLLLLLLVTAAAVTAVLLWIRVGGDAGIAGTLLS